MLPTGYVTSARSRTQSCTSFAGSARGTSYQTRCTPRLVCSTWHSCSLQRRKTLGPVKRFMPYVEAQTRDSGDKAPPPMKIEVKQLTGQSLRLEMPGAATARQLQLEIFRQLGIPVDQQRLVSGGATVSGRDALSGRGGVFHLVLRLSAGAQYLSCFSSAVEVVSSGGDRFRQKLDENDPASDAGTTEGDVRSVSYCWRSGGGASLVPETVGPSNVVLFDSLGRAVSPGSFVNVPSSLAELNESGSPADRECVTTLEFDPPLPASRSPFHLVINGEAGGRGLLESHCTPPLRLALAEPLLSAGLPAVLVSVITGYVSWVPWAPADEPQPLSRFFCGSRQDVRGSSFVRVQGPPINNER